jgi:M6 family metalloprotease-like protein
MEVEMKRVWLALLASVILTMGIPLVANGTPAYQGIKSYVQPDSTVIEYRLMGDERFSWRETPEGDVIVLDKNSKYYVYGQFKDDKIVKSGARVGVDKKPFVRLTRKNLLSLADYALRNDIQIDGVSTAFSAGSDIGTYAASSGIDYGVANAPLNPAPEQKILVVLVDFANVQISRSDLYWSNSFFSPTSKSVYDYYDEVSRGTLAFEPVPESYANETVGGAVDDGVVRVKMPYNHPAILGYTNTEAMMDAITSVAVDAIEKAAASVTNLSSYDTNGNGVIENSELHIVTIFAGYEMSSNSTSLNAIWAHAMNFGATGVGDLGGGLRMEGYMAVGEKMDPYNPITIGVFCHELGHSLGLPDLYDYGNDSQGLGPHSLMSLGSWGFVGSGAPGSTPTHLDAWSKARLGFVALTSVKSSGSYTLNAQTSSAYNVLKIDGGLPGQYFLLERRSLAGYDEGLDFYSIQPGVAIYHIDENVMEYGLEHWDGLINENEYRKAVDLEEANMGILGYSEMDRDSYYWDGRHYFTTAGGLNTFGANTNPSSGLYDISVVSPFYSIEANGVQNNPSGINVTVVATGVDSSGLNITVPDMSLHATTISNQTYTGAGIQPAMLVYDGTEYLQHGVDFTTVYHNNVLPGKATVDLVGIGAYAGLTGQATFVIVPKPLSSLTLRLNEKYSDSRLRYRTIKASWPAAVGASGYYVAYRASTSTTWSSALVTGTSWTKTLSAGTMYYVRVKPYVVTDGTKRNYSSAYSPQKYQYTLKAPGISLARYGTRSVKVYLGSVIGESGYDVRRATSLNGTYYHKAYVKANTSYWIDSTTYVGKTYYYKIRAYKVVNGVTIYGPYSTVKSIRR